MSTVLNQLDSFMNRSTDSQINQIVPLQLTTSGMITNLLDVGVLSSQELNRRGMHFETGYDEILNSVVYLNVITKVEGIEQAVFSAADGIFAISMERKDDETLIEGLTPVNLLEEKFQEKLSKLSNLMGDSVEPSMYPMIREIAKHELLAVNADFLEILQSRVRNIAILILDIEPIEEDKLDDPRGVHDAIRDSIFSEKIKIIITNEDLKDTEEMGNIVANRIKPVIFVREEIQQCPYTYKTQSGVKQFQVQLCLPNYRKALREIFKEQFDADNKCMFIHTARI